MKFDAPMFGSTGDLLVHCEAQCCRVVFMNNCFERAQVISISKWVVILDINHVHSFDHLEQCFSDRNDGSHCLTECTIFGFTGAQCNR